MDQLICEIFDSESSKLYPTYSLNLKDVVPQLWGFKLPGNDELVARLVSYASKGDAIKKVKQGDKYAHLILMSLSKNGTPAELRGGLGSDPIGALNTIFETVYKTVLNNKMDAVLFRFPAKKMKGQEKTLQRIMERIVKQRSGGKFEVVEEMYNYTAKHAYILIKRKVSDLESIKDIPGINHEEYTKVESKVGDVYVKTSTGEKVSKDEAIAGSIAVVEEKRTDRSVIARTKISRDSIMTFMYGHPDSDNLSRVAFSNYTALRETSGNFIFSAKSEPVFEEIKKFNNTADIAKYFESYSDGEETYLFRSIKSILEQVKNEPNNQQLKEVIGSHTTKIIDEIRLATSKPNKSTLDLLLNVSEILNKSYNELVEYDEKFISVGIRIKSYLLYHVSDIIQARNKEFMDYISRSYLDGMTKEEKDAISSYCGSYFRVINKGLLGKNPLIGKEYSITNKLDSAFSKGVKLPKETVLYRAGLVDGQVFSKMLETKTAYFPNFVSTSLSPFVFGDNHASIVSSPEIDVNEYEENNKSLSLTYIIRNADKVKVIVPGQLSRYKVEAEVILPRGTVLKINKVYKSTTQMGQYMIDCDYVQGDYLEEQTQSVGRFSDFINESFKNNIANEIYDKQMQFLADIINPELPEKFVI